MTARKGKSNFQWVKVLKSESVAEIRLNRPDRLNAFHIELAADLGKALKEVARDRDIRAVVLRGEGRAFSAGGDLKMFRDLLPRADRGFRKISALLNQAVKEIRSMAKPVIAGVHGPAYAAGFGLVLACDLILASESARFSASFINIALTPNGSSTVYLPRFIGWHRAAECFFTGRVVSAEEALKWGVVNRVVQDEEFDTALWNWAYEIAQGPTQSMARIKRLMNESLGINLSRHLEKEKEAIAGSATTPDFAEGVKAFVEKRKAVFKG